MQKMIGLITAAALLATAMPVSAEGNLYERNLNFLLGTVPADGVMEVQTVENGEVVTQLWTTAQYAAFRAAHATAMGRDYTAGFQGAPAGAGDQQYLGDIWTDHWGTTTANVRTPRGVPRTVDIDDKLWIYGGSASTVGVFETDNICYFDPFFQVYICSSTFGWTYPQSGAEHDDAWMGGSGIVVIFASPFGSLANIDGAVFAANL